MCMAVRMCGHADAYGAEHELVYVALSRVRSLQGLQIVSLPRGPMAMEPNPLVTRFYQVRCTRAGMVCHAPWPRAMVLPRAGMVWPMPLICGRSCASWAFLCLVRRANQSFTHRYLKTGSVFVCICVHAGD